MEEGRGSGHPCKRSVKRLAMVVALAIVAGLRCSGGDQDSAKVCDPGDTRTCVGPGACPGGQACLPDGSGYAECDCGGLAGTGGTATGGASGGPSVEGGVGGTGGAPSSPEGGDGGSSGGDPNEECPEGDCGEWLPRCTGLTTSQGYPIERAVACTSLDPQLCYLPCGPGGIGSKPEICLGGAYAEGDCEYASDRDYSCYAIPEEPICAGSPPRVYDECDVPECTLCDGVDGYCLCLAPDAGGKRYWGCASPVSWPCPDADGC